MTLARVLLVVALVATAALAFFVTDAHYDAESHAQAVIELRTHRWVEGDNRAHIGGYFKATRPDAPLSFEARARGAFSEAVEVRATADDEPPYLFVVEGERVRPADARAEGLVEAIRGWRGK